MFDVVLVASVRAYREAVAAALGAQPGLTLRAEAGTPGALAAMAARRPDVVLVDFGLPALLDLLEPLHRDAPKLPTIGIAIDIRTDSNLDTLVRAAELGMTGFVDVDQTLDEIVTVAERAADGRSFCSPRIAAALMQAWRAETPVVSPGGSSIPLTTRESDVASLAARGLTNRQIATRLTIAESTVKTHIHSILAKLELGRRYEIASAVAPDRCGGACSAEKTCTALTLVGHGDESPPLLSLVSDRSDAPRRRKDG